MYRLQWLFETALRPTPRNLEESFEGWAYRGGLLKQIHRLEAQGFIESLHDPRSDKRLHRLTEAGRLVALGGRDPVASWAAKWDRKWRLILFDIPEKERSKRRKLTRSLAEAGCGCLQGSVWILPTTPPALEKLIGEDDPQCSHLLLLLADSKGKRMDARMVAAAWDFEAIHSRYRNHMEILDRLATLKDRCSKDALAEWSANECAAWRSAVTADPLLPAELLPSGYIGRKAWRRRLAVLADAARIFPAISNG